MLKPNLVVYKASAGSGKTFILAAQYVKLLLRSEQKHTYRSTLAVTFTNKATAEMRERILEQLYGIWKGLPSSTDFLDVIYRELEAEHEAVDKAILRQRAGVVLKTILHDYSRFRVETIDSFFQTVLRNLAHELNLTANLQVELDDIETLGLAVDHLMDQLHQNSQIRSWVLSHMQDRIENDKRWDVTQEIKQFARNIFSEKYLTEGSSLAEKVGDDNFVKAYRNLLNGLKEEVLCEIKIEAGQLENQIHSHGLDYSNFTRGATLRTYLKNIEQDDLSNTPSATLQNYLEGAEGWLTKANQKNSSLLQTIESQLLPLLTKIEQLRQQNLITVNSCELSLKHLTPLRLLNAVDREVTLITQQTNRFLLAKTPILLHELIGKSDAPFIFEKMGTMFQHIMIDEFQDTSSLQWKNFKALLLEIMSSGGGNLLVGDVKQSIYRWRGGDWNILNQIEQEMSTARVALKNLDTNYRSEPQLIAFNNDFFVKASQIVDEMDDKGDTTLQQVYADVAQKWPANKVEEHGYVDITLYKVAKQEECEEDMLDDLHKRIEMFHQNGIPYSKMAILLRKKRNIDPIINYFSRVTPQIKLVSDEAFRLSSSGVITTLIAAMRFLYNDADRVSYAYLASRYQHYTLASERSWSEILLDKSKNYLPEAFQQRYEELRQMPLYELQEELLHIFGLERIDGEEAYLFVYLDRVMQYARDNTPSLAHFLTYWDEKLAVSTIPSGEIDGIRILTIHKSKGLQFHTVFMPYCQWKLEREMNDGLLWCVPNQKPYNSLPLLPIPDIKSAADSIYQNDYRQESLQLHADNLNMLYVAFTRAEKNLIVWGGCTDKKMKTVADLIYKVIELDESKTCASEEQIRFTAGSPLFEVQQEKKQTTNENRLVPTFAPITVKMESQKHSIKFKQSNRSKEFIQGVDEVEKKSSYIEQGKLLHKLFSTIHTADDVEAMLKSFEQEGLVNSQLTYKKLKGLVVQGLSNPTVADWFASKWETCNECAILYFNRLTDELTTRRPDRVITSTDETIVIDFKFGTPKPEYRDQVKEYMQLMLMMQPHKAVKGYLWYVYKNQIEEVY